MKLPEEWTSSSEEQQTSTQLEAQFSYQAQPQNCDHETLNAAFLPASSIEEIMNNTMNEALKKI